MKEKDIHPAIWLIVLQGLVAAFFLADTIYDGASGDEGVLLSAFEIGMAFALVGAILASALLLRRLLAEGRRRERALAMARGALGEVVAQRFAEWSLSRAESDVALFALKGCSISEIAGLRGSAEGTVRAQLSQLYTKAGVSSQAGFIALFVEELLD